MPTILHTRPAATATTPGILGVIGTAACNALQWRLLLLWAVLLLLPTFAATLPIWQMLGDSLDQSIHASTLARALDMTALSDLMQVYKRYNTAVGNGALSAVVLTLLLSPLLTGMTVSAARAPVRLGLRGLLSGGMLEYGRLLRTLLWSIVPLGAAFALGSVAAEPLRRLGENAVLESTAHNAGLAGTIVMAVLLVLAHATVDAGRAVLAADRRKTSAVRAWGEGLMLVLRRPLATLGTYVALSLVGLVLAGLVALVRIRVAPVEGWSFFAALALTQLAVMAVAWMRSARLFALIALIRK
ncbi:hypothetical protein [Massilia sp. S19_KUP03_FR1]|uniref:hypothetical protein n=1 Tax=Massilia sp. S19_KUP03_FR1 TaxID=3025503 RepID=UPI002FCD47A6